MRRGTGRGPTGRALGVPIAMPPDERPRSVPDLIHRSVLARPGAEALRWKEADGSWRSLTYAALWERVAAVSLALAARGIGRDDRVVILSRSGPDWLVADLASLALGAVTCPIYPGDPPGRMATIVRQVGARLVFVETAQLLARLREGVGADGALPQVVLFEPGVSAEPVGTMAELEAFSPAAGQRTDWEAAWRRLGPELLATIPSTPGEDGEPRGVLLTHGNVVHNLHAAVQALGLGSSDLALSVLPMSHMLERGAGVYVPLGVGGTVAFAERRMERWAGNLAEVRPTVMICVPPFFAHVERRIRAEVAAAAPWQRAIFGVTGRLARLSYARQLAGRRDPWWLRVALGAARRATGAGLRRATGGRLRFFISGGAPLPRRTAWLFWTLGVPILEGYGLTETAPLLTVNRPGSFRFGTVGPPVAATELRIDPASGEVMVRGPQVMRGYLDRPDLNDVVLDADGWFRTGDRGAIGLDGRLRITGLLKNLIVLATGKKVAPGPIERAICDSPLIRQAVLLGDGEECTVALIHPDETGIAEATAGGPVDPDEVRALVGAELDRCTAPFGTYERPRRFALLPRELSRERGEVAADGRPDRRAVRAAFSTEVAALFESRPIHGRPRRAHAGARPRAKTAAPATWAGAESAEGRVG